MKLIRYEENFLEFDKASKSLRKLRVTITFMYLYGLAMLQSRNSLKSETN